jgi:hypothetical protein
MTSHTPTPWELFDCNGIIAIRNPRARSSKSEIIFWSGFDASHYPRQAAANAAFIVKAVNNHEALVKALERAERIVADRAAGGRMLTNKEDAQAVAVLCREVLGNVG